MLYKKKLISTKSSYFTNMLVIYSKQAYKLFFTLVGKTQTKHHPDQPYSVICSLFTNYSNTKFLALSMYLKYVQISTRHDSSQFNIHSESLFMFFAYHT